MRENQARFSLKQRFVIWHQVWPSVRVLATLVLVASLIVGTVRWVQQPTDVGALEFTQHIAGGATTAVGVRETIAGDMDGDGDLDIITTGDDGVKVYENKGGFSFTSKIIEERDTERAVILDVDGDEDLDIVVGLRGGTPSARWYENTGDLEFTGTSLSTAGSDAIVGAGDIDQDGDVDIVTVSTDGDTKSLQRWMNNGSASFSVVTIDADSKAESITVGDLDNNNYPDIVISGENGLQRWDTEDGATWTRVDLDDSNANRTHLALGDPNNGGTWVATADANVDEVALYRSSSYGRHLIATSVDAKTVKTADLNGDGFLDIVVSAEDDNSIYWYENDGLDHFTQKTVATGIQSPFGVDAADFDNDGDLDIVTSDHNQGTVYVYERLRVKPSATAPGSISQSTKGDGFITFSSTVSDTDGDPTRARIQYSTNGDHWYKPWLLSAKPDTGSVDLKNSNGYQVGTSNPIDTDTNDQVEMTYVWDTKSVENTGGPITGEVGTVQLRVIPRDNRDLGSAAISGTFKVDNAAPAGLGNLTIQSISETEATLTWDKPTDTNTWVYKLYYGTDHAAVLEQRSAVWDSSNDAAMDDIDTTTTTVTGLTANQLYTFKLFAIDAVGNKVGAPSVRGTTSNQPSPSPSTSPFPGVSPSPSPSPSPGISPSPSVSPSPGVSPSPSPSISPSVSPSASPSSSPPSTLDDNQEPVADAGPDMVVNERSLVILDGTASFDLDPGDTGTLIYRWQQIAGPEVELISATTATPSFSAEQAGATYILRLSVFDLNRATSSDTVTVAVNAPQDVGTGPQIQITPTSPDQVVAVERAPAFVRILAPVDILLFLLSLLSTILLIVDRVGRALREGGFKRSVGGAAVAGAASQSKVVHYRTGEPIPGAQVLIYGEDGKVRAQEQTNAQGVFASFLPAGHYTLGVRVNGYTFAATANKSISPPGSILYTGGKITVRSADKPPTVIIPMKPSAVEVPNTKVRLLHVWQAMQRYGRILSWPIFLGGALLNTLLVFVAPSALYLVLEVLYVILVLVKITLEIRVRPAYGVVRDAITHVPLELAVVRLFEQGTKRLVMTRVTNNQGKFFALPPAGVYTITVSKPGYATFTKSKVEIKSEHDTTLQMTASLMPVAPQGGVPGGLARAKAQAL